MKDLNMLVWLTQLGISVAVPPAGCTLGAVWLRNYFQLGPGVIFLGSSLGIWLAVDGFRTSLNAMERMSADKRSEQEGLPASINDRQ